MKNGALCGKFRTFVAICPKNGGGSAGYRRNVYLIEKWLERVTGRLYTIIVIVCHLARPERTADSNMYEDENEV